LPTKQNTGESCDHTRSSVGPGNAEAAARWFALAAARRLGLPGRAGSARQAVFQARYRGKRYSFGYPRVLIWNRKPSCFRLLRPEEIGVQLTEAS